MSTSTRIERINSVLNDELSHLIQNEVADPRVALAYVTRVATSRDLATARVFVTISGVSGASREAEECLAGLRNAVPFLRKRLAEVANFRRTPDLVFNYDDSEQVIEKLDDVMRELREREQRVVADTTALPRLEIYQGDITTLDVDAVVNAANTELRMGSGVAGALLVRGGQVIQDECDRLAPIPLGEAAVTTGGNLRARYIIHAAAMGYRAGEGMPTPTSVEAAYLNTFKRASERQMATIGVPALGTGIGGFPLDECARVLRRVIIEWRTQKRPHPAKVIVCVFDQRARKVFEKELHELL